MKIGLFICVTKKVMICQMTKKDYMPDDKKRDCKTDEIISFSKLGPVPAVPIPVGQEGNAFDQVFHHLSPFLDFCQNDTNEWQ